MRFLLRGLTAAGAMAFAVASVNAAPVKFKFQVDNVSTDQTLTLSDGKTIKVPISPGIVVVFRGKNPVFKIGNAASAALQPLAEDGNGEALLAAVKKEEGVKQAEMLIPGQPIDIEAEPGDRLSFAVMFVQSNDLFYSFRNGSVRLFDKAGNPLSGDITKYSALFDAGTEVNEAPGEGPNQAPRQGAPNTGPDEKNGTVHRVVDQYRYPKPSAVIKVTISPTP